MTMPSDDTHRPSPEWRAAQHRVRNDLQTLAALARLSERRENGETLAADLPGWLTGLAAVYDVLPLWDDGEHVSLRALADALHTRCDRRVTLRNDVAGTLTVPATSALAVTLGLVGLLGFACAMVQPGTAILLNGRPDDGLARLEAVFRAAGPTSGWPPSSLALAAQALGGHYAMGEDGDETVAVMVLPCR